VAVADVELTEVESTSIEAVGYDPARAELHLRFRSSGRRYIYKGVPPEVYEQLLEADSKGQFVNWQIKDVYPYDIDVS
jgi:hypothetical protein